MRRFCTASFSASIRARCNASSSCRGGACRVAAAAGLVVLAHELADWLRLLEVLLGAAFPGLVALGRWLKNSRKLIRTGAAVEINFAGQQIHDGVFTPNEKEVAVLDHVLGELGPLSEALGPLR